MEGYGFQGIIQTAGQLSMFIYQYILCFCFFAKITDDSLCVLTILYSMS